MSSGKSRTISDNLLAWGLQLIKLPLQAFIKGEEKEIERNLEDKEEVVSDEWIKRELKLEENETLKKNPELREKLAKMLARHP